MGIFLSKEVVNVKQSKRKKMFIRCKHGKLDRKVDVENLIQKSSCFLYKYKKVESKSLEVTLWNHDTLYWVYSKLNTKFQNL
jgi:hypothetical protein